MRGSGASFLLTWAVVVVFLATAWTGVYFVWVWAFDQPLEMWIRVGGFGLLVAGSFVVGFGLYRMERSTRPSLPPVGRRPVGAESWSDEGSSRFPSRADVAPDHQPRPRPGGGPFPLEQRLDLRELDHDIEALRARRRRGGGWPGGGAA